MRWALSLCLLGGCAHAEPWWRGAVVYEVFARSLGERGLGELEARLDLLNDGDPRTEGDLGIDAIWLTPIHPSPSAHGYDVTNYRDVHPALGTLADFDRFIAAAHARGVRVILDYVLNHASSEHPDFIDPARRDRFVWRDDDPAWTQPWSASRVWHPRDGRYYYGLFWGGMPDWNLRSPAVEAEHATNLRFWAARGVDGFRIDAARYLLESEDGRLADLPESLALVSRLRRGLDTVLVAEAWTELETVARYRGPFELAFGFDTSAAIKTAVRDGARVELARALSRAEAAYADRGFEAPFLGNHDMPRVMRALGGDARAMRLAAAILLALPGTPTIYAGEEIGMQGDAGHGDEDQRTPVCWAPCPGEAPGVDVASQRGDPGSLWRHYRRLIALRHASVALARGELSLVAREGPRVLAFVRASGGERVLFAANLGLERVARVARELVGPRELLYGEGADGEGLEARGFAFYALH